MDLGHDPSQAPSHEQTPAYTAAPPWTDLHPQQFAPSPHLSPAHEYGGFNFMHSVPPAQHLSTEATGVPHAHPPPLQPMQGLRPLVVPPPWPSTLTGPPTFVSPAPPPPPPPPPVPPVPSSTGAITTPISAASSRSTQSTHSTHSTSSPRRTLTDTDRRKMCQYHEDNPTVKQTEIGALFGVERSTVSKVLRHKDKYLFPDDGRRSPIRRYNKGPFPDIERALSNWARNTQRTGTLVTDGMIKEKARFFANTVGNSDSHAKINSRSWLEKFKQRNHLAGAKLGKVVDEASDVDARRESNASPPSQTSNGISPISPKGVPSPSPLTTARSHESLKTDSPDSYVEFAGGYRLYNSHSATSLSSVFTDTAPSSFSAGPTSPISPYYSPPDGTGHFFPPPPTRLPPMSHPDYGRPRSQTFPTLGMDPMLAGPGPSSDDLTPRYHGNPPRPGSPPTDSPLSEMAPPPPREPLQAPSQPVHPGGNSPSSMPPPRPPGGGFGGFIQVRGSPTPEDARRALEVVMTFFQQQPSGVVDPQEFMAMGKLMEKLRLQGASGGVPLPGGLHQIPEQEELASVSSRLEPTAAGL